MTGAGTPRITVAPPPPPASVPWRDRRALLFLLTVVLWAGTAWTLYLDALGSRGAKATASGAWWRGRVGELSGSLVDAAHRLSPYVFPAGPSVAPSPGPGDRPRGGVTDGCVIVTMIAGNSAARHAVALVQSLRDVDTKVRAANRAATRRACTSRALHRGDECARRCGRPLTRIFAAAPEQVDDIVVMVQQGGHGSPECADWKWRAKHNLSLQEGYDCGGSTTIAEEIVSPMYVKILRVRRAPQWHSPPLSRCWPTPRRWDATRPPARTPRCHHR